MDHALSSDAVDVQRVVSRVADRYDARSAIIRAHGKGRKHCDEPALFQHVVDRVDEWVKSFKLLQGTLTRLQVLETEDALLSSGPSAEIALEKCRDLHRDQRG